MVNPGRFNEMGSDWEKNVALVVRMTCENWWGGLVISYRSIASEVTIFDFSHRTWLN